MLNDSKDIKVLKKFDIDLAFGRQWEEYVDNIFSGVTKCEVKTEKDIWVKSGNMVIEVSSWGKDSGIITTESEIWVQNFTKKGEHKFSLMIPVEVLKEYIKKKKPRTVKGGDNYASILVLIKITDFIKYFLN